MSGICGFWHRDGQAASIETTQSMLRALAFRGPDRQHAWSEGSLALGHVLLATTPEARRAQQPWRHPESGCIVVADSRLDEREALCRLLDVAGDDPGGDAALLHAAWQRWGEDCAEHLLGDFAFAVWDPRRQLLYCARDQLGVRPLCIFEAPGLFAFASEPEAMLVLPGVDARLDEVRIADAFTGYLEAIDETSTHYRDIKRLPPATWLLVEAGGTRRQRYWSPVARPPVDFPAGPDEWIEALRAHLVEAVRCRLRADVPVGSMLSGGLDSTSVVAIASQDAKCRGEAPFQTFSAVSALPDCAETRSIALAIATLPIAPNRFDARAEPRELQRIVREWSRMGSPFDHVMAMQDALYAQAARNGVRVLLDGIDADSLFAEPDLLGALPRSERWRQAWSEARGLARFYGEGTSTWSALRPLLSARVVPQWLRAAVAPFRERRRRSAAIRSSWIDPGFAGRSGLDARYIARAKLTAPFKAEAKGKSGLSATGLGTTTAALERYNRVASRHGIEPRHPFLDRRLVELCAWMPLELRQRDGWPKWALRRATESLMGAGLAWRRGKEHLGPYVNQALFSQIATAAPSLALLDESVRPFVDPTRMHECPSLQQPQAFSANDWEHRMFIAALQAWLGERGPPRGLAFLLEVGGGRPDTTT